MSDASQATSPAPPSSHGTATARHTTGWEVLVACLLVAGVVAFVHLPALDAHALSIDDEYYLLTNDFVLHPSLAGAKQVISEVTNPSSVPGYYQPLTMLSLMLDSRLGGGPDNLRVFHVTSLLLHAGTCALLVLFLYGLFGRVWPAALAALLFGLHPLTVDPIPWVSERKTLLATFFAVLALAAYVRYVRTGHWRWQEVTWFAFALGLLAKPTITPLPVLLLVLDYWPLRSLSRRCVFEKTPLFALAIAAAAITFLSQHTSATTIAPGESGWLRTLFVVCHNLVLYVQKFFVPIGLTSHYPFPVPLDFSQSVVRVGVIGTGALLGLVLVSLRWTRAPAAGAAFFFIAVFPALGVIGFTNAIAGMKYLYFPALGLLLPIAGGLAWLWTRRSIDLRAPIAIIGIAVLVFLGWRTRVDLRDWRDTETLYASQLQITPDAPVLRTNYGLLLLERGDVAQAEAQFRAALRLAPHVGEAHYNLGEALFKQNRFAEAVPHLQAGIATRPEIINAHLLLGRALRKLGRETEARRAFDAAVTQCQQALFERSDSAPLYNHLGQAHFLAGRVNDAIAAGRRAVELDSTSPELYNNLGVELMAAQRVDEAREAFANVVRLDPDHLNARLSLGRVLQMQGRTTEAIEQYDAVLRLDPTNAIARRLLDEARAQRP